MHIFALYGFFFGFFAPQAFAQQPASLQQLHLDLQKQLESWEKHRLEEMVVLDIRGLEASAGAKISKEYLERRLETLENKKISNREWSEYWKKEGKYAQNILKELDKLTPQADSGPLLSQANKELEERVQTESDEPLQIAIKNDKVEQLRAEHQRWFSRKDSLTNWIELTKDKVKNQKTYFDAIEADIVAINGRLKHFGANKKSEEDVHSESVCDKKIVGRETPIERQRLCIAAIQMEIEEHHYRLEQSKQNEVLTSKLLVSIKKLITAQVHDEKLVIREEEISHKEYTRTKNDQANDGWSKVWESYANKATTKKGKLSAAVKSSKTTQRILKAKKGVAADRHSRFKEQMTNLESSLKERKSIEVWAITLLETLWKLITVGWPALIYLSIALFIVRSVKKYQVRQEERAAAVEERGDTAELIALKQQYEDSLKGDNEERSAQLNDEIVNVESRLKDEAQRISTISRVASQAVSLVVWVTTTLLVLDALTVDIAPILGGAAIFGLAISFGSQSLVKDVVSGFFILLENQFAVGDYVSINGKSGGVEKITLRRTVLRDMQGNVHNITNGSISSVTNMTQGWSRVVVEFGVEYTTDIKLLHETVNQVGKNMYEDPNWRSRLSEKPTYMGIIGFGDNAINVRVQFKTRTFQNWAAEREFNYRLNEAFKTAGLSMPFPQRTIHMVTDEHLMQPNIPPESSA